MSEPAGEVVLYQREGGAPAIEVRLDGDTVWLSQQQLADLFQTSRTNVVEHVRHIYDEGELEEAATCGNFRQVRREGNRDVRSGETALNPKVLGPYPTSPDYDADASKPHMGLASFAGASPRKSDVSVAKNYLDESELKKLNTLVSAYFDAAEFRAPNRQPTFMKDWLAHLDRLIAAMDAQTLANAGSISHKQAKRQVEGGAV